MSTSVDPRNDELAVLMVVTVYVIIVVNIVTVTVVEPELQPPPVHTQPHSSRVGHWGCGFPISVDGHEAGQPEHCATLQRRYRPPQAHILEIEVV